MYFLYFISILNLSTLISSKRWLITDLMLLAQAHLTFSFQISVHFYYFKSII